MMAMTSMLPEKHKMHLLPKSGPSTIRSEPWSQILRRNADLNFLRSLAYSKSIL